MTDHQNRDLRETTGDLLRRSIARKLEPFTGHKLTDAAIEQMKRVIADELRNWESQSDNAPPVYVCSAEALRDVLGSRLKFDILPADAALYATGHGTEFDAHDGSGSLRFTVFPVGEWRWGQRSVVADRTELEIACRIFGVTG
jgi:hypothetical protein